MQVKFTLGIPDSLHAKLAELVETSGRKRNGLVREGVELVLKKYGVR